MAAPPLELLATVALTMPVNFRLGADGRIESVVFGVPQLQAHWAPNVVDDNDTDSDDDDGSGDDSAMDESGIDEDVAMSEDEDEDDDDDDESNNNNDGEDSDDDDDVVILEEVINLV